MLPPLFDLTHTTPTEGTNNNPVNETPEIPSVIEYSNQKLKQLEDIERGHREELLRHSHLDRYLDSKHILNDLPKDLDNKKIDPFKILPLTNLGFSAKETGYEGGDICFTAALYVHFFSLINKLNENDQALFSKVIPVNVINSFRQLQGSEFKNYDPKNAIRVMNSVRELKPLESFTMAGGWAGTPGHAMIYRFYRARDNSFWIYIYNAQNGAEFINGGKEESCRKRIHPYTVYQKITHQELFFSEPHQEGKPILFENLLKFLDLNFAPPNCDVTTILACFCHIPHRHIPGDKLVRELFISVQRSGNCPVKSSNCLLLDLLGLKKNYKHCSLDLKFFTLVACFYRLKIGHENGQLLEDHQLFQQKEAAENFLRILDVNFKRGEIEEKPYTIACATVSDLLIRLDAINKDSFKKSTLLFSENTFDRTRAQILIEDRKKGLVELSKALKINTSSSKIGKSIPIKPEFGANVTWADFKILSIELLEVVKPLQDAGRELDLVLQVEAAMRNVAHLKNQEIPINDRNEILEMERNLHDVFTLYKKAVFKIDEVGSASSQNTGMEFLLLAYCLAVAADKEYRVLKDFGIYTEYFDRFPREDRLFTIECPTLLKQRYELEIFIKKNISKKNLLFNFDTFEYSRDKFFEGELPEGVLYRAYTEKIKIQEELSQLVCREDINEKSPVSIVSALQGAFESCFIKFGDHAFPKSLRHIGLLKTVALFSCETSNIGKPSDYRSVYGLPGNNLGLCFWTGNTEWYSNPDYPTCRNEKRYWRKQIATNPELLEYVNHSQSHRSINGIKTENQLLIEKRDGRVREGDSLFPFFLALAAPNVQTTLLLNATEERLDYLKISSFRICLAEMFVKLVENDQKIYFSPFIESLKDTSYLQRFEKLIEKGKHMFVDILPQEKPRLDEMLFLIRLYGRALQTTRAMHTGVGLSKETFIVIRGNKESKKPEEQGLIRFLDMAMRIPQVTEEKKIEIQIAKLGLLSGIPLEQLSGEEMADLFLCHLRVQNFMQAISACEDPSFLRETRRSCFSLRTKWNKELENESKRNSFANNILSKELKFSVVLEWKFDGSRLTAVDSSKESWLIDLDDSTIRNSKGCLLQKDDQLDPTPSFKRLFGNKRYILKVTGNKIYFEDEIWKLICITTDDGRQIIQRNIQGTWYTYIPLEESHRKRLQLNQALFYDHALWFKPRDPDVPNDNIIVQAFDLKTGALSFTIRQGVCESAELGKQFYYLGDAKKFSLLNKLDEIEHVNGWISPDGTKTDCDFLEYSRISGGNGKPLQFLRRDAAWIYSANSDFRIDARPNLKFGLQLNRFLVLIDKSGNKIKLIVPHDKDNLFSKGYARVVDVVVKKGDDDRQKGALRYFEYDVTREGRLIPPTLDAKVYLAHLYLAQKSYQDAMDLFQSISVSEDPSESILESVQKLLGNGDALKDHSPNASAIRLFAYYTFKKLSPFSDKLENIDILSIYYIYVNGLNHVELHLKLDVENELELIGFLIKAKTQKDSPKNIQEIIQDRKKVLENQTCPMRTFSSRQVLQSGPVTVLKPHFRFISFSISEDEKLNEQCVEANNYFKDVTSPDFLSRFSDFERCYRVLKEITDSDNIERQAVIYELLTAMSIQKIHDYRQRILSLVASYPNEVLALPLKTASSKDKFLWYSKLQEVYARNEGRHRDRFSDRKLQTPNLLEKTLINQTINQGKIQSNDEKKVVLSSTRSIRALGRKEHEHLYNHWQKTYMEKRVLDVPLLSAEKKNKTISFNKNEEKYSVVIKSHLEFYERDCQIAKYHELDNRHFKTTVDLGELRKEIEQELLVAKETEDLLKNFIQNLSKRAPVKFSTYVQSQVELLGQRRRNPSFETFLRGAVSQDWMTVLRNLNPNLSPEECQDLREACIAFMIETTHRTHLERIHRPLQKYLDSVEKNEASKKAAEEAMNESRQYNPQINTFALLFEYLSGAIRIRGKQASIINRVLQTLLSDQNKNNSSVVFQLIMNGGKTSVIISLLIEMISEAKNLSWMLCHHSQLASVRGSLQLFQSQRFSKDIYALDYNIKNLSTLKNLNFILTQMTEAKTKRCALVSNTTFPHLLALKLIIESIGLGLIPKGGDKTDAIALLQQLQKINKIIPDSGIAFYDECDINLSIMTDVVIPLGKQKNVKPERAYLVKIIFEALLDQEIKDLIGYEQNLQTELSSQDLQDIVLPHIAQKIFTDSSLKFVDPSGKLPDRFDLKSAFVRFVCGQMSAEDQKRADEKSTELNKLETSERENVIFLRHLKGCFLSDNLYVKESANLIALARNILDKVLRVAFSRSYNQGFGRDLEKDDGSVIPYLGANEEAKTKFGNIYIMLAYHFLSSLNHPLSIGEIRFLANKMSEAAHFYSLKEGIPFGETCEARQFKRLTTVDLELAGNSEQLELAAIYVNDPQNLKRRLDIEAEVAPFHIRYYTKRACSTAINGVSQFKKSVACSGTTWNYPTYNRKFGKPMLDEGTEGSILNLMRKRELEDPQCIHTIEKIALKNYFDLIDGLPREKRERLRALVDIAGHMRDYSNAEVAVKFLSYFKRVENEGGPKIRAIIYLHKFSPEEVKRGKPKECFVILKQGETELHLLKNTTQNEIERVGVAKEDLFAFFDELRIAGTDIHLADNALFLNTVDHKMPTRHPLQGYIRARKAFEGQRNEFIVSKKSRAQMINGGKTLDDLIDTFEKNEAIIRKEQTDRAQIAQIDDVIRSSCLKELINADVSKLEERAKKYENFFIGQFEDLPYDQWGRILGQGPAYKVLESYADERMAKFKLTESKSYHLVKEEMDKLLEEFKKEIPAEEEMNLTIAEDVTTTLEIEEEEFNELELTQNEEMEISTEIQSERDNYNFNTESAAYEEKPWGLKREILTWEKLELNLLMIRKKLATTYRKKVTTNQYESLFPENMWFSKNFYYTFNEELPIFHPCSKLAGFVLIFEKREGDEPQFILLSEKDAVEFKMWLSVSKQSNVVLVDLKGTCEVNHYSMEQKSEEYKASLLKGLWYANLFNGEIQFLDLHPALSKKLITDKEKLIIRFLQLRAGKDHRLLHKLMKSQIFDFEKHSVTLPKEQGIVFSDRRNRIENNYMKMKDINDAKVIGELPPENVKNIHPHQVKWLKTKEQLSYLPDELLNSIKPEQVALLHPNKIPLLIIPQLIQSVEEEAAIEQISPKNAHLIKKECRIHIKSTDVLLALPDGENLSEKQKEQIRKVLSNAKWEDPKLKPWQVAFLPLDQLKRQPNLKLIRRQQV